MQAQSGVGDWFSGDTLVLEHLLLACLLIPLPCVLFPNLCIGEFPANHEGLEEPDVRIRTTRDKVPSVSIISPKLVFLLTT